MVKGKFLKTSKSLKILWKSLQHFLKYSYINYWRYKLRKKCPYSELFLSTFSRIWTEELRIRTLSTQWYISAFGEAIVTKIWAVRYHWESYLLKLVWEQLMTSLFLGRVALKTRYKTMTVKILFIKFWHQEPIEKLKYLRSWFHQNQKVRLRIINKCEKKFQKKHIKKTNWVTNLLNHALFR